MDEMQSLERRADVAMKHVELNMKKIRQQMLKDGSWDLQRLQATNRIIDELCDIAAMINELWETPTVKTVASE
jgi:hypothetical protein